MRPVPAAPSEEEAGVPPAPAPGRRRRRLLLWGVLGAWVVILALAMPFAGGLGDEIQDERTGYLPDSADSTQVARLVEELPGGDTLDLILVYERAGGLTADDRATAERHAAAIADGYGLTRDGGPQLVPAENGATLMVPFSITGMPTEDEQVEAVGDVRDLVADHPAELTVEVGGPGGMLADSDEVYESADSTLTMAAAAVVAVLLILIYRSPYLWLLPLFCVGVAAISAMAIVYALIQVFGLTVTSMSSGVMTVLIFGAGTDYALLLVARYREELRRTPQPYDAMRTALRRTSPAVLASSGTVAAGLLCLLAADLNSSAGLGPVGAVGVLCALAVMLTLLPALLVLLGRRVFWPKVPVYGSEGPGRRGYFDRMGSSVGRRPAAILAGGVVLLGALAIGMVNLPGTLKQEDGFTDKPEAVTAGERLADAFPEQGSQPITVLARTGRADDAVATAEAVEGIASAGPVRSGDSFTEITVYAADPPESAGETAALQQLRADLDDLRAADAVVGGPSAEAVDLADANSGDLRVVIPLTLGAVLLILIALLRSVVAALVLTAAVVASWGAAMGLGGLFFGPVFGFPGFDGGLPLLSFVISVALGVDYGIFLMHRMREEALRGAGTRTAALTALGRTGGVIASAGLVLAATFATLTTMPMVIMIELGFIVVVGVLLDTFLVRTYLVTSASWLLDRRVWWPGRLSYGPPADGSAGDGSAAPAGGSSLSGATGSSRPTSERSSG